MCLGSDCGGEGNAEMQLWEVWQVVKIFSTQFELLNLL